MVLNTCLHLNLNLSVSAHTIPVPRGVWEKTRANQTLKKRQVSEGKFLQGTIKIFQGVQAKMNKIPVKEEIISSSQPPSSSRKLELKFCSNDDLQYSFITECLVLKAIESFGEHKAPSGGRVKPKALQKFIKNEIGLTRLTQLFRASLELSYCPQIWAEENVIFLEKSNKVDEACVKSFWLISLMSYLLKSLKS